MDWMIAFIMEIAVSVLYIYYIDLYIDLEILKI